jgi:hypothetical protein
MTGARDPNDDAQWQAYQQEYRHLGSEELVRSVQEAYEVAP